MRRFSALLLIAILAAAGCNDPKPTPPIVAEDPKIKAEMDKLAPEDRSLAEAQRACPITDQPLGSMGVPIKVTLHDKPVFLCCKSCEKKAKANPDETLKKVEELKSQVGAKRG